MNTEERIEEIIKGSPGLSDNYLAKLDKEILRLQLENLVTQAKLEQLQEKL